MSLGRTGDVVPDGEKKEGGRENKEGRWLGKEKIFGGGPLKYLRKELVMTLVRSDNKCESST